MQVDSPRRHSSGHIQHGWAVRVGQGSGDLVTRWRFAPRHRTCCRAEYHRGESGLGIHPELDSCDGPCSRRTAPRRAWLRSPCPPTEHRRRYLGNSESAARTAFSPGRNTSRASITWGATSTISTACSGGGIRSPTHSSEAVPRRISRRSAVDPVHSRGVSPRRRASSCPGSQVAGWHVGERHRTSPDVWRVTSHRPNLLSQAMDREQRFSMGGRPSVEN